MRDCKELYNWCVREEIRTWIERASLGYSIPIMLILQSLFFLACKRLDNSLALQSLQLCKRLILHSRRASAARLILIFLQFIERFISFKSFGRENSLYWNSLKLTDIFIFARSIDRLIERLIHQWEQESWW